MTYKALVDFKDLRDGGYEYKAGDTYPRTGEPDVDRVRQLMTPTAMRGALIVEDEQPAKKSKKKS